MKIKIKIIQTSVKVGESPCKSLKVYGSLGNPGKSMDVFGSPSISVGVYGNPKSNDKILASGLPPWF